MNIIKYFYIVDSLIRILNNDLNNIKLPRTAPGYISKCLKSNILIDTANILDIDITDNEYMFFQNISKTEIAIYCYYKPDINIQDESINFIYNKLSLESREYNIIFIKDKDIIDGDTIESLYNLLNTYIIYDDFSINKCIKVISINLLIYRFIKYSINTIRISEFSYNPPYFELSKDVINEINNNLDHFDSDYNEELKCIYIDGDILSFINSKLFKEINKSNSNIVNYSSEKLGSISFDDTMFKIGEFGGYLRYIGPDNIKPDQPVGLKDYSRMFYNRKDLTSIDLSDWDMSNVKYMMSMFNNCTSLKDISSLKDWDVSNVKYTRGMFCNCSSLENISPLKEWNVSNVEDMKFMFNNCTSLVDISSLSNWDMSNLEDMSCTFKGCTSLKVLPEWYKQ